MSIPSVVNLTLLYNNLRDVIPAPYQVRGKLQRESRLPPGPEGKDWIPDQVRNDKMRKVIYETRH